MAETDVLVVGGGPGGLSAALASAREGVETMLVERYGCFGGNITQAMIGSIAWYRTNGEVVDAAPYQHIPELGFTRAAYTQSVSGEIDRNLRDIPPDDVATQFHRFNSDFCIF